MRSESKPRLEIVMKNMFNMKHSKLLLPILTLLIAFSALAITTQPVRGANPNILYIAPPHIDSGQTLPASVHFAVKVFQMDSFNTWDIQVAVDPTVLNPTSLTITPNTLTANFTVSELELTNCVNGAGSGCDPTKGDGPGVVHSAVFPLGSDPAVASISGVLFNITYSVVNPAGFTTVHLMNTNIVGNGVTIVTTNQDGNYGTPPSHATTTSVACSSPIVINQASTCRANVTDTSTSPTTPTGTVSFAATGPVTPTSGTCTLGASAIAGTATCATPVSFTGTASGTASVTGTYGGDTGPPAHTGSASAAANIIANKRSTLTAITCASPVVINQASSCSVTVTDTSVGTAITPTGTVTFTSTGTGSLSAASCTLTAGSCTVSFTGTAAGSATVIGTYGGDGNHNGSGPSTSNTITVNKRSTSTTVICSPNSVVVDQTSSCTATVTDTDVSTTITPTGSVAFTLSAGTTGGVLSAASCTLAAGSCSVTFQGSTGAGTATVTGTYGGDAAHTASPASAPATITVNKDNTTTAVVCTPSSIAIGGTSTCAATVTDTVLASRTATGSVAFTLSAGTTGGVLSAASCTLAAGSCSVTFQGSTGAGTATVTGTYGGDANHNASPASPAATITVNQDATTTAVVCTPNSILVGGTSTCTATVTDTVLASRTGAGSATVTGTYGGDANHATSTSAAFSIAVGKDGTSTAVVCTPSSIAIGGTSTCAATVSDTTTPSNTPTGSVAFTLSAGTTGGVLSAASCTLAAGSCSVTFQGSTASGTATVTGAYGGDTTHNTSTSAAFSIAVGKDATSTAVVCTPSSIAIGGTSTCAATVSDTTTPSNTPTGSVAFTLSAGTTGGVLSAASCTLAAGSCSVTFQGSTA